MSPADSAAPSVGATVDDHCRICKMARRHTVIAVADGRAVVLCDTCGSRHNFRGGPRVERPAGSTARRPAATARTAGPLPPVSERERSYPPMPLDDTSADLELMLRRVIREECGLTPAAPAERWRGGEIVLRPARGDLQEKSWPIETFFNKIVMIRNRLRTMEQQINGADLPQELKVKLQGYITGCYGSLTSFNILFADEDDRFRGSGGR